MMPMIEKMMNITTAITPVEKEGQEREGDYHRSSGQERECKVDKKGT